MRLHTIALLLFTFLPFLILARSWTPKDQCPTEIRTLVSSNPCIYAQCDDVPRFHTMADVHSALTTCPNITALDLRVTGLGCTEWPDRWNFPFKPAGGETYPRLKSLKLEGYAFEGERSEAWHRPKWRYGLGQWLADEWEWMKGGQWVTWWEWRQLSQEQREKSNFALWVDAMDWSGIEELMIDRITPEVLHKLPSQLHSLRKLESANASFVQALQNNTLTHLSYVGPSDYHDLPAIIERQGKSLQSLEFRCPELSCPSFLPDFDISILPKQTPNLTHISTNIPRNGTWPLEALATLSSIPTLQSADLYMNIQSPCRQQYPEVGTWAYLEHKRKFGKEYCKGEDQYQKPFLDGTSALELFEYMTEKKDGIDLKHVTFWVGDWTRGWDGPLYFPVWMEGRAAKVVCKAGLENEAEDWCIVENGEKYWEGNDERW